MVIKNPTKCSNCGSENLQYINPNNGTSYVLTTIDQSQTPPAFNAGSGVPVHLFGCVECGVATLQIPALVK